MKLNANAVAANVVAGAAFLASAQHIYSVAEKAGNPMAIAGVHAIGIDGLILIGINGLGTSAKRTAICSIVYGAGVSLAFNAASYGAFKMPPLILAATMPIALVLAYITLHSMRQTPDTDTGQDRVSGTRVSLSVEHASAPMSAGHGHVRADVLDTGHRTPDMSEPLDMDTDSGHVLDIGHGRVRPALSMSADMSTPVSVSADVLDMSTDTDMPARTDMDKMMAAIEKGRAKGTVTREPRTPAWDSPDQKMDAIKMIQAGELGNKVIACRVFDTSDPSESQTKRIQRLRAQVAGDTSR